MCVEVAPLAGDAATKEVVPENVWRFYTSKKGLSC